MNKQKLVYHLKDNIYEIVMTSYYATSFFSVTIL